MIARTGAAAVLVLTILGLGSEAVGECPGGHIESFDIRWSLLADTRWTCNQFESDELWDSQGTTSGRVECFTLCIDAEGQSHECPGPKVEFTVSGSSSGYTITAHAEVSDAVNSFRLQGTSASITVSPNIIDGEMLCIPSGASKSFEDGTIDVEPIEADPEEPAETYSLYCSAWGASHSGSVDCTLTVTCEPLITSGVRHWNNPAGGGYHEASNWYGHCSPVYDAQRTDSAWFALPSATFIPVSGAAATADKWRVSNGRYEFSGSGQLFSNSTSVAGGGGGGEQLPGPSLVVNNGGQLRLASGATLDSIHTAIGSSDAIASLLEVKGGQWSNAYSATIGPGRIEVTDDGVVSTGALTIGAGNGPGTVRVTGDNSRFDVTGAFIVGGTNAGTLEIDQGLVTVTPITTAPQVGKAAPGVVTVRGDDADPQTYGNFQVFHTLVVGEGSNGRLNVVRGGHVSIDPDLVVGGYGTSPSGEVVVDAQGGDSFLGVARGTFVNATELQEVVVRNGGHLKTKELFIGNRPIRPGAADVTVQGPYGIVPTLNVGSPSGGGQGTYVGEMAPGQLNIHANGTAELFDGLFVGSNAQGIVSVAGSIPTWARVHGETQVGINAPGIVQLDLDGSLDNHGDLKIGLGSGNPSGLVKLTFPSSLDVNGTLHVGYTGIGLLEHGGAGVHCDTLVVGGSTFSATGILSVASTGTGSTLEVRGNAQVGVGAGRGEILLADSTAHMSIGGTMTIGHPSGGPGGGAVALVDAQIFGAGNIVVNPNGALVGTGSVNVPKVNTGGTISPGLSPGTLTIDGDLEMLPGGKLVIEYAGTNPGEFDALNVTGQATLGGRLEVHFRDGFSPPDPDGFIHQQDFVESPTALIGDYDERLYIYPDLFADFDDDGDKDLLDLAAFQNCFGLSGAELEPACERADWESDSVIGDREVRELSSRLVGPR